ncbi:MAG: hypothetical protein B7Z37_29995 [Verrucomicrobia bacterium 12-59-8]|nr:MAG: hypothetical protein B7Z37_29995 [Verrucomicrobia bacterium 12-59-8]
MTFQKFISLMLAASAITASADTVTVTGLENDGNVIGQYVIGGETYWWLCIEPGPAALSNATISAQTYSFSDGWDKQNLERYNTYQDDLINFSGDLYNIALPKQISVMSYVLDTYLPWSMAGASGRFLEQDGSYTAFNDNDTFHNSLFAVQNFLSETYGKMAKDDFTDMSDYVDYYVLLGTPVGDARSTLFQNILSDVQAKANDPGSFFENYVAEHDYTAINTMFAEHDLANNWQDGIIIVPEPGSALLIGCCGLAWMIRRRRRI